MNRRLLIGMIFVLSSNVYPAAKLTISGYVVNGSTGETIIGANVMVRGTLNGAASDGNGFFQISGLEPGSYILDITHIAFQKRSVSVGTIEKSVVLPDIALDPKVIELRDISIVAKKSELADLSLETGHRAITQEAIRRIPTVRNDVFRAIKYLPGVEGIDPLSPLYVVRGSDTGENLILLDGVPIYNPYHYVVSSGLFNVYAIKNAELMVGGFGVEYGGRNSSVLYITTREGNNRKIHGELSPGTTHTNGVVDFPVGKQATMMLSGRWYYDLIGRFLFNMPTHFYDMNVTLTWNFDPRHKMILRYFHSRDVMDFESETYFNYLGATFDTDLFDNYVFRLGTYWRNQALSATLKSVLSPSIYWQTQVFLSSFSANNVSLIDYEYIDEENRKTQLYMETDIRGKIRDIGLKTKLDISLSRWNEPRMGLEWNGYHFENDVLLNRYSEGAVLYRPRLLAAFFEDKINLGLFSVRPGVRFSKFGAGGDWNREFRINAAWSVTDRIKLKASWGEYLQYIVSINTQEYELSQFLDTYYPLEDLKPSASTHVILGLEAQLTRDIQLSLDVYHKNITRVYAYDYNASQLEAGTFFEKLREGEGRSYGFELLIKGHWRKTSGWISYGWSRSTRRFPHIMDGKIHPFDYNRPHVFKAVINHRINNALEFGGSLRVLSGMPKTLETGLRTYYYFDPVSNQIGGWPQVVTPVKNNIRMPFFLRLDLGMKKQLRTGFGATLAKYLGADAAFMNVTFGNLLFAVQRNVWFYVHYKDELYGIGTNYLPEITMGYSIQF